MPEALSFAESRRQKALSRGDRKEVFRKKSADVVQMILVLVFFIEVPKASIGGVLSFVSQFSLLDALMGN
jgi:hypothetical protein